MRQISTGEDSTLATYRKIAVTLFGESSNAVDFMDEKIKDSKIGGTEEVIVDESQMLHLFGSLQRS